MTTYSNPVIRGISPDPSIVRVGEDYYLANSTMNHLPGITISHSRDLIHWHPIGGAVTRPAQYRPDGRLGPIVQAVLDMTTGQLGRFRQLTPNYGGFESNDIEAPHLYHIDDW
ncbi:hypothetical protein AX769_22360 (plasmid) [Frondihabitans sp. PAMC 28766]|uniref:family 43 glycosylhydrolase n=1 Tax=Frondihabitans sp. PAMC 28766 TaxID=1795630 RepID=UPI00078BED89|nr:family 43 glycosylhydrolase [Frondihabitans sp. PAMC 28766]AMM22871.1 hypothetical protein AX769_22360 [Frondihabitans sp. PAMC 28766]